MNGTLDFRAAAGKSNDRGPFGNALKHYRELARVSQSKLAERAGFDHSYVSRLESGARTPTREAVIQLADALGLDTKARDDLLAAAGFLPQEVSSLLTSEPELSELLHLLHNEAIPEPVRKIMREQLRLLAEQTRFSFSIGPGPMTGVAA